MTAPGDALDRLMAVMEAAFDPVYGEAWTRKQVEDALALGNCHYCLIAKNGQVARPGEEAVGFSLSRTGYEEEELLLFAVSPEYRRSGIGKIILDELISSAKSRGVHRVFLEMRRGNPAESLYRRCGFFPVGVRPNYYHCANLGKIDAITFALDIF